MEITSKSYLSAWGSSMAKLGFSFSYANFTRYLYGNCDSEQMADANVNEKWLYRNMEEYIKAKGPWEAKSCKYDEYKPRELGGRSALDFVAFVTNTERLSVCLEAK